VINLYYAHRHPYLTHRHPFTLVLITMGLSSLATSLFLSTRTLCLLRFASSPSLPNVVKGRIRQILSCHMHATFTGYAMKVIKRTYIYR
jgi:hypothetical protein